MRLSAALFAALLVGAILTPTAGAQAADDPVRALSCATLYGGTVNSPDPTPFSQIPEVGSTAGWPHAPDGLLPARVYLRSTTATYNGRYAFATRNGQIYVEPANGGGNGWRQMPLPLCMAGHVTEISADDDELEAIDEQRRIFSMDNALKGPALFNWTRRWGPPTWTGLGRTLPNGVVTWSWSVISPAEDRTWTDAAGNPHAVGTFKDSHIWALRTGGQRLSFFDPWLPDDQSYEMCGPLRGRFRAVNLSASGSTVFVIGRHGDLFTRLYDFDIAGSDPIFFHYAYDPQREGDANAAIQLPSPAWIRQPKVPGQITSAISIEKTGTGAEHRILRVEGLDRHGHTGYWEKDSAARSARAWRFHRTNQPLSGRRLPNSARDTAAVGEGRSADIAFAGGGDGLTISVPDWNVHCTPAALRLYPSRGRAVELRLHSVDGLRQTPAAAGLDGTPREEYGAVEVPGAVLAHLDRLPASIRAFITGPLHSQRFTSVTLHATAAALSLDELGVTLARRG